VTTKTAASAGLSAHAINRPGEIGGGHDRKIIGVQNDLYLVTVESLGSLLPSPLALIPVYFGCECRTTLALSSIFGILMIMTDVFR